MGCCVSKKKPSIKAAPILKPFTETPTIFIEENFKLVDYSHHIKEMKIFSNIRNHIDDYKLSDIRCVKRINENNEIHSSVVIISNHIKQDNLLEELS